MEAQSTMTDMFKRSQSWVLFSGCHILVQGMKMMSMWQEWSRLVVQSLHTIIQIMAQLHIELVLFANLVTLMDI